MSASRRTDIPAFYSRWFLRRLAEGFCHWIHPFNGAVRRISLRAEETLGIVVWTRNPAPLAASLESLQRAGHRFAFHISLNGYPKSLESHNPPVEAAVTAFRDISGRIPAGRTWWRYDPIVLTAATPPAWHLSNFSRLAGLLEGATSRCYFSFASLYRKTRRNLDATGLAWREPPLEEKLELIRRLSLAAREHGIRMYSCCDDRLLAAGVEKAHCVDADEFAPDSRLKRNPTRQDCGCSESVDIGAYDTCAFGCAYCYATRSRPAALGRLKAHDPEDTVLWRPATLAGQDLDLLARSASLTGGPLAAFPA